MRSKGGRSCTLCVFRCELPALFACVDIVTSSKCVAECRYPFRENRNGALRFCPEISGLEERSMTISKRDTLGAVVGVDLQKSIVEPQREAGHPASFVSLAMR